MKPDKNIDEILNRYITSASEEDVESHCDLVFHQLRSIAPHAAPQRSRERMAASHSVWRQIGLFSAAAAVLLVVFIGVRWRGSAVAIVESVDGTLLRSVEGKKQPLLVGDAFNWSETVRTDAGSTFKLSDGSRVEMRSGAELLLENADDGVRIRLNNGGVIVNAAKQHGHLYVQTKDVTVSVVGTVFLVNAEEEGSRVAVIEGEVRVQQQGTTEKKLRPGEQVATNPLMVSPSVKEEISWSRNAETHLALLHQSAAVSAPREAFDLASIRMHPGSSGGGGRGDNILPSGFPAACGGILKLDPRRFLGTSLTVYQLITLAYDKNCEFWEVQPESDGLSGGPEWIRSDKFDIEALMPEGPLAYTTRPLNGGMSEYDPGPRLQGMLQSLLAQRFNLVLRPSTKEMPVYILSVAKGGPRLTPWKEGEWIGKYFGVSSYDGMRNGPATKPYTGMIVGGVLGGKASMSLLAFELAMVTGRPVLDRTGVAGDFDYEVFFAPADYRMGFRRPGETRPSLSKPSLLTVLEEELGLKLEAARAPVEILTIEHVEKPSEN